MSAAARAIEAAIMASIITIAARYADTLIISLRCRLFFAPFRRFFFLSLFSAADTAGRRLLFIYATRSTRARA